MGALQRLNVFTGNEPSPLCGEKIVSGRTQKGHSAVPVEKTVLAIYTLKEMGEIRGSSGLQIYSK